MRFAFCVLYVCWGALLFALPNMMRREILFAVPVATGFRESAAARRAIANFRATMVAIVLLGLGALALTPERHLNVVVLPAIFAPFLAGGVSYYLQHRRLAPAAIQFIPTREAELTLTADKLPRFVWLEAGPFAILAAAATWLYLHWERIPARYAIHFDLSGRPNGWALRTVKGVYGPLFFAAELCAWMLIMALATWFGSRRSRLRPLMLGIVIGVQYLLAVAFAFIPLQAALGIPVWVIAFLPIALLIPLIMIVTNKLSEPGAPDPTPNECWKGAIFYYNPNDAALCVEKRGGWGYTFNFANPWSWVLLLGLALVLASGPLIFR
jgi:uncharacterized membrane protein